MMMKTELAKEFAQQLDARSLSEIASWCEMASKGLCGRGDESHSDGMKFLKVAKVLRDLQCYAYRKDAA